jgi:hypothetical protein
VTAVESPVTIADPAGIESPVEVWISLTEGDAEDVHRNVTSVCINGRVDMSLEQAGQAALRILELVLEAQR